jgi:Lrp/AsnC family transcriptional regulator
MVQITEPISLSDTDLAILRAIQRDASATVRELAEQLSMSPSTLWRKLNDLQQVGAIRKRVALLDADKVGVPVCVFVFINLVDHEKSTLRAFERFVNETPEIMECFSVTGAHDYTLIIRTKSVSAFELILMDHVLAHPAVAAASSQVALRQHKYATTLPI